MYPVGHAIFEIPYVFCQSTEKRLRRDNNNNIQTKRILISARKPHVKLVMWAKRLSTLLRVGFWYRFVHRRTRPSLHRYGRLFCGHNHVEYFIAHNEDFMSDNKHDSQRVEYKRVATDREL